MAKKLSWNGLDIFLLAQKALYIPAHKLLVISDWHLGKLGHFRKEGFFIPQMPLEEEFSRLGNLLASLEVSKVVFLGDLFHSDWNHEWDAFTDYLKTFPQIAFVLTRGNHDILPAERFETVPLHVVSQFILTEGIVLSHEPLACLDSHLLNIVGHVHPGCEIAVRGRQTFRLPCFCLERQVLTLPAFGRWTGFYMLRKNANNRLFAVVNDAVIEVPEKE